MDAVRAPILISQNRLHISQIYPDAIVVITEFTADSLTDAVRPVEGDVFPTLGLRVINHTVPPNPFF